MKDRKTYVRAFRVTERVDLLIDQVCSVCNRHDAKLNGDDDVNGSTLLGFLFEKISHAPNKEDAVFELLFSIYGLKNEDGTKMSREDVAAISKEIINGN